MTDDKDLEDKVFKFMDSLEKEETLEIKKSIEGDDEIPQYPGLLSSIEDSPEIVEGTTLGHWKILKHIGQGGMSNVYLVERDDGQIQLKAALKVIPQGMVSESLTERFQRERQILSDLNHSNIAKLYDAGLTDQGVPWFVMEYIEGLDIISYANEYQLNIEQRIILFKQVCDALVYAHSKGIVHRDIKPSNLMVNDDKTVKLLDFGIAASDENASLTMTGMIVGTPGYLSPEQAKGLTHGIDRRSDIFSLGVLFYKLVQQEMPFQADSISEISFKTIHSEPTAFNKNIPKELQSIIYKCLEKKVTDRYSSAKELLQDIDAYLNGDVVMAREVTLFLRASKKVKKHPVISKIIFVAIVLVFASIGYGVYQSIDSLKRVQMTKEYMTTVQDMKGRIGRAHLLPLHNVQGEYIKIAAEIEDLRTKIEKNDVDDTGFSDFTLGLAYQNMKKFKKSLEYFQQAEHKGWKSSELSSGLGIALAIEWSNKKIEANTIADKKEKELFLEKAKKESYMPAVQYLKHAQIGAIDANYLAARLAYIEGDYDAALQFAEAEIKANPWHYEALRLSSQVYLFKFKSVGQKQGYDVATKYLDLSNQKLEQSINIGRSDPYNYTSRCTNASIDIQLKKMFKLDDELETAYQKGIDYCLGALELKPDAHSPWSSLNILYTTKAAFLESKGLPAIDVYNESLRVVEEGLKTNPDDYFLLSFKVKPLVKLAEDAIKNNQDPQKYFNLSVDAANKAIKANPENSHIWSQLANLQMQYADYLVSNPATYDQVEKFYLLAIQSYDKNYKLGNSREAMLNIAQVEYKLSQFKLSNNQTEQAIELLYSSIKRKKDALPFRKVYISEHIEVMQLELELVSLLTANNKNIDIVVSEITTFINNICEIEEISTQQLIQVDKVIKIYIENKWLSNDNLSSCYKYPNPDIGNNQI